MENSYIKQFPDIMAGKKVMYVHGFGSSAESGTVHRLREVLPEATIIAEDVPLHPQEAIDMLRRLCEEQQPDLIVGTSMGGMYTEMLYGYDRIMINPALAIGDTMVSHGLTGQQHFFSPRKDGVQDFIVTKGLVKEYKDITKLNFLGVNDEERGRVIGLFGDNDDLVDTYELFSEHYPTAIRFHGAHRMDDQSFMHAVLPVIRWMDDRQEGREREKVFIATNALIDRRGMAEASSQKAFRRLIEHYDVYIVAPAPRSMDDGTEQMKTTIAWADEYINVPAYNHVLFTNQPQLLLGDFFITTQPCDNFMGTVIPYRSDTFKTWEEIITYFDRITR
ncbi:MAG: esterase [Prevotella sp.]|nr:esterase [Prevotella sp.]